MENLGREHAVRNDGGSDWSGDGKEKADDMKCSEAALNRRCRTERCRQSAKRPCNENSREGIF